MQVFNCKIHGLVKGHSSGKFPRCSLCNNERMRVKHQEMAQKAMQYKGGKCVSCGYDSCRAALEFHHLDKSSKEFNPSKGYKRSWEVLKAELDKCVLLCANCHREVHAGFRTL